MKRSEEMKDEELISLREALAELGAIEELESRLELACVEIDTCFVQYCWMYATGYLNPGHCFVQCGPFNGCHPYCY